MIISIKCIKYSKVVYASINKILQNETKKFNNAFKDTFCKLFKEEKYLCLDSCRYKTISYTKNCCLEIGGNEFNRFANLTITAKIIIDRNDLKYMDNSLSINKIKIINIDSIEINNNTSKKHKTLNPILYMGTNDFIKQYHDHLYNFPIKFHIKGNNEHFSEPKIIPLFNLVILQLYRDNHVEFIKEE